MNNTNIKHTNAWVNVEYDVVKKVKTSKHERKIVNEMIKDVRKCFNRESNFWTNQQVLCIREVFRGVVVKSWVALPLEGMNFSKCDKILVRKAVELNSACWRE